MHPTPIIRAPRALILLAVPAAAVWTALPLIGRAQPSQAHATAPAPAGTWRSHANGDRVNAVLRETDTVWSGTDGGVVRWDFGAGIFRQYLAPQDGLPSNDVRALLRDPARRLWAATAKGLARFDPMRDRWSAVPMDDPDLLSRRATALAVDTDGTLWVGFEQWWDPAAVDPERGAPGAFVGGGVARYDARGRHWGPVFGGADPGDAPEGDVLPSSNVNALLFDRDGALWVGTRPSYVWHRQSGGGSGGGDESWVQHGGGLAVSMRGVPSDGPGWVRWQSATSPCVADTVHALAVDDAGRVWAGMSGRGLQVFTAGPASVACVPGKGHAMYARARLPRPGLPGGSVLAIAPAGGNRLWVGVANGRDIGEGVAMLDHGGTLGGEPETEADDTWTTVPLDVAGSLPGAVLPAAIAVMPSVRGPEVVVGTRDNKAGDGWGLRHLTGDGEWHGLVTAGAGLPSNRVRAVAVHPITGDTWVGTDARGVARWDGTVWKSWRWSAGTPTAGPAGDNVSAIAFTPDGRVWAASQHAVWDPSQADWADGGLAVFDGDRWTALHSGGGTRDDIQALAVDTAGRVWAGTAGNGAAVYDPTQDTWTVHDWAHVGQHFGGDNVTAVAVDAAGGDVWLAHSGAPVCDPARLPAECVRVLRGGGVSRWDGTRWSYWSKTTGAALQAYGGEGDMTAIAFDAARARVWAGAWVGQAAFHWFDGRGIDGGLNACPQPCSDAAWSGARFEDGGAVRALAIDSDGRLWMGLNRSGNGIIPLAAGVRILGAPDPEAVITVDRTDLPSNEVTALAPAAGGKMWVGTWDRGAAVWSPLVVRSRAYLPAVSGP